jgi:hypothetical protein
LRARQQVIRFHPTDHYPLFRVRYPGSAFRFMADWPDDEVAAFVTAARNGTDEPLMVLPPQKALF